VRAGVGLDSVALLSVSEDLLHVHLGKGRADALDRLAGAILGGPCAAFGLGDPVQHLAEPTLPLDLLGLERREALCAGRPGLRLRGARLHLLEALSGRLERLDRSPLALGEPSLGLLKLLRQLLLLGAALGQLALGLLKLGQQRRPAGPLALGLGAKALLRRERRLLGGLADALLGLGASLADAVLRAPLHLLDLADAAVGLEPDPILLRA
jgi:hypothetical protein